MTVDGELLWMGPEGIILKRKLVYMLDRWVSRFLKSPINDEFYVLIMNIYCYPVKLMLMNMLFIISVCDIMQPHRRQCYIWNVDGKVFILYSIL